MKKIIDLMLLGALILLSIATAITKLIQMPAEIELFENAGFSLPMTIGFGIIQLIGGILLIPSSLRRYGAMIMFITFVIATAVVFYKGMIGFGCSSILFIALAGYQWWKHRSISTAEQ